MNYPGGKNQCYQKIINLIPPHRVYIETHAGSAAVARYKRPAKENILIEIDREQCEVLAGAIGPLPNPPLGGEGVGCRWRLGNRDAAEFLDGYDFQGDEFVYADPPYVMSSRSTQRPLYRYEYSDQDHIELLTVLKRLPCKVMISGYPSELYDELLPDWTTYTFQAQTRGGSMATEVLWMNYSEPTELHDYRYLGDNFRERERIKRKKERWKRKLKNMDILERRALLSVLRELG